MCLLFGVAELFVVVAVSRQDDEKILRTTLAELLVEIASIDFLLAEVAFSNCPVLKVLLARSKIRVLMGEIELSVR